MDHSYNKSRLNTWHGKDIPTDHPERSAYSSAAYHDDINSTRDLFLINLDRVLFSNAEVMSNTMKESLRALRTNIQFCGDDIRTILFTSASPNEGKSTVVRNLGLSFVELGKKVLILDTDMRKSVFLGRYHLRTESGEEILGLSHYLSGQTSLSSIIYNSDVDGLYFVWAGQSTPNPTELLEKKYFQDMLSLARNKFDYVLIDCAPLNAAIDSAVVAKRCDGAVLVIWQGQTSIRAVKDCKRQLVSSGVRVLGCVINKVKMERNHYYGKYYGKYYGSYYGKYYGNDEKSDGRKNIFVRLFSKIRRKLYILMTFILVVLPVISLCACGNPDEVSVGISAENTSEHHAGNTLKFKKQKYAYDDDIKTYLIMGTDHSGNEEGRGDEYQGSLADFLALIIVNRTQKTCGLLEINRNTITDVNIIDRNGDGEAMAEEQICTAHWYGGNKRMSCQNTIKAVSRLLGKLPVDGYYSMGISDIGVLNHAVGGVTVTIEDDFSNVDQTLVQGETITLNDEQAVSFLQGRKDIGSGDNLSRMKRQDQYMKSLLQKVMEEQSYADNIWDELGDRVVTDIDDRDISIIKEAYSSYDNKGFFSPEGETALGDTLRDGVIHEEFYVNTDSLINILVELCDLRKTE